MTEQPSIPGRKAAFRRTKLANILWFAGLALLLALYWRVMTNDVITDFWDPQYAMKAERLRDRMRENPGRPLWLVLGTSRVERGLRPGILVDSMKGKDAPLIFNFGMGGANMFRQYICLRRLLEDGVKPQKVGIEMIGAIMSKELFEIADAPQMLVRARKDELGVYASYSNHPAAFMSEWEQSRWNPAYRYGMKVPHQTLAWRLLPLPFARHLESVPYDQWGWYPEPPAPIPENIYNEHFELAKTQFANKFDDFKISSKTDGPLRQILALCREQGIEVFLLKMPESKEFQAFYTPESRVAIDAYLAKIQSEYGVPLVNATTWIDRVGFTDGHHLNATGAEEFTRRFVGELDKIGKTGQTR